MPLQVYKDGAITMTPAKGEVIHTKHARRDKAGRCSLLESREQGIRTDSESKGRRNPCRRFATDKEGQFSQSVRQSHRFSGVARRDLGNRLREDTLRTVAVVAEEPARRYFYLNGVSLPGQIRQLSVIAAVDSICPAAAQRTAHGRVV
jgi:hypothetical protein